MTCDLLLKGGVVVTPEGREQADVAVSDGQIAAVGSSSGWDAAEVLDCRGLHILPGVIDTQVHFREPGLTHKEDIESGSRAAVMGGVTTYFEMPNTSPATTTEEALRHKLDVASRTSWSNYAFFIGASPDNVDDLARLEMLPGTPGVKIFMGSSTGSLLIESDEMLEQVLRNGKRPCPVHAEDEPRNRQRKALVSANPHPREHPFLRDAESARMATERLIAMSRKTGRPVHVLHISTLDELPLLKSAKEEGLPVTCEATPQHLTLEASLYETLGSRLQMNPPIRSEEHRAAIFAAFQEGLFDVLGSDHAPHTIEEKAQPFPASPSGMPGVQTLLPIMLNWTAKGALRLEDIVLRSSRNPARLYGIKDRGSIAPGKRADLAIVDLARRWTVESSWLQSRCGWSPYEGWELTGRVEHVVVDGRVSVRDFGLQGLPSGRQVEFDWKPA